MSNIGQDERERGRGSDEREMREMRDER